MKNLLVIKSSIFGDQGNSSQLINGFVDKWQQQSDKVNVIERDLAANPIPHLDAQTMTAWMTPEDDRTEQQTELDVFSLSLINELNQADAIVLGLPMYNFGVPSTLKAYFDHIARAGITFKYTDQGPVGLIANKPVYVLAARGGMYQGTEKDSQTRFIKDFLAFIGLTDVHFVYAEGVAMGDDAKNQSLSSASEKISELIAA